MYSMGSLKKYSKEISVAPEKRDTLINLFDYL